MRRIAAAAIGVAFVAAAVSTWSLAAPEGQSRSAAKRLPPLPASIKQQRRWRIGVKCDTPPFGYIDLNGHNTGYDIEIARWFSRFAFGRANRVSFTCVTTAS